MCDTQPMVIGVRHPLATEGTPGWHNCLPVGVHVVRMTLPSRRCVISTSHDEISGAGQARRLHHLGRPCVWHAHYRRDVRRYGALSPAISLCASSPCHLWAITPLCLGHEHDVGKVPCPLTDTGASLVRGLACPEQSGDTAHDHARPVPRLPGVDDVDGRGVGLWA